MELLTYYEIHHDDTIYRLHPPVRLARSNRIRHEEQEALRRLRAFKRDFSRWNLYGQDGQVIQDSTTPAWRIDVQSSSQERGFWWALQGPGNPSPVYANATGDDNVRKFPNTITAPYVAQALEKSWADSHTWHVPVTTLDKRKRKHPPEGSVRAPGSGGIRNGVKEPTVVKEGHYLDAGRKFLCFRVIEQVPKTRHHAPRLWDSISYLEKMWAILNELRDKRTLLKKLLDKVITHDTFHGGMDVGAGSAGVAAGGLMLGGFLFPPLWVVGAVVGGASAVTGLTSAGFDHANGKAHQQELTTAAEAIQANLQEMQQALVAQRQQCDIIEFVDCVANDTNKVSALVMSAAQLVGNAANPVRAVMLAVPELSAVPRAADLVTKASEAANIPEVIVQAANIPRMVSQISEASTVATLAGEGATAAEAGALGGGGAVAAGAGSILKVGAGVVNIAAGGLQLGLGINRLVNGSNTSQATQEIMDQLQDFLVQIEEIVVGNCAVVAQTYKIDSNMLSQLIEFSVADGDLMSTAGC